MSVDANYFPEEDDQFKVKWQGDTIVVQLGQPTSPIGGITMYFGVQGGRAEALADFEQFQEVIANGPT